MLLKISLHLKLSVHQKRHLYSLLGITLTIILIQAVRIRVLDQSWLIMETSVVNPNKKRLFLEIGNKFRLRLILTKLFRSENILHRINQLSEFFFFCGHLSRKNFKIIFQTLNGIVFAFSSNTTQAGLAT